MTAKVKTKSKAKAPAKLTVNKEATVLDARGHKPESRKAKVHALVRQGRTGGGIRPRSKTETEGQHAAIMVHGVAAER